MRNKHPGTCYRCGEWVEAGAGHFERHNGGWRVQHATCAITHRKEKQQRQQAEDEALNAPAQVTGGGS